MGLYELPLSPFGIGDELRIRPAQRLPVRLSSVQQHDTAADLSTVGGEPVPELRLVEVVEGKMREVRELQKFTRGNAYRRIGDDPAVVAEAAADALRYAQSSVPGGGELKGKESDRPIAATEYAD